MPNNTLRTLDKRSYMATSDNAIFKKDQQGNNVYFMWGQFGKGYIIDDSKKLARLIDLEGYRHFILSYKPPIIMPVIVLALMLSGVIYLLSDSTIQMQDTIGSLTLGMYGLIVTAYLWKIKNVLKNCETVSKEEREWIWRNV